MVMKHRSIAACLSAALALGGLQAVPARAQLDILLTRPLATAVEKGDYAGVRQYLLKGESPNQIDAQRQPLLVVAASRGYVEIAEALIKAGAVIDATDQEGRTALIRAAERGDPEMAQMLLKYPVRVNAQDRQGISAMMMAARNGTGEIVRALLAKKADPNLADYTGRTAMVYARESRRGAGVVDILKRAGGKG
jgi:ankyrin repeat protein